jgi:hypothetical protein
MAGAGINDDMTKVNPTTGTLEQAGNEAKIADDQSPKVAATKEPETVTRATPAMPALLSFERVRERAATVTPLLSEIMAYSRGVRHWGLNE